MQPNLNKKKLLILAGTAFLLAGGTVGGYFGYQQFYGEDKSAGVTPISNKIVSNNGNEINVVDPVIKPENTDNTDQNPIPGKPTETVLTTPIEPVPIDDNIQELHPHIKAWSAYYDEKNPVVDDNAEDADKRLDPLIKAYSAFYDERLKDVNAARATRKMQNSQKKAARIAAKKAREEAAAAQKAMEEAALKVQEENDNSPFKHAALKAQGLMQAKKAKEEAKPVFEEAAKKAQQKLDAAALKAQEEAQKAREDAMAKLARPLGKFVASHRAAKAAQKAQEEAQKAKDIQRAALEQDIAGYKAEEKISQ